jgi:uncharacterized protein (DUF433 family)
MTRHSGAGILPASPFQQASGVCTLTGPVGRCRPSAGISQSAQSLLETAWLRDNVSMATTDKADLSRITILPGQRSGQPCIRGLRVTVWDVLDMLASGMTEDEILHDYPYLEKADFPAVYAYASQAGRERISR